MIKNWIRIFRWILFLTKTNNLKNIKSITEIGAGESNRIPTVLSFFHYKGSFYSIDKIFQNSKKSFYTLFKINFIQKDYFDYKNRCDLLIFDHAIDDMLAAMLENDFVNKDYGQIMDNTKLFDYQDPKFISLIESIIKHAQKLINPPGKIIICNYLTKHDYQRNTVDITLQLLPQIAKVSQKFNLKVDYLSKNFLVLKNI